MRYATLYALIGLGAFLLIGCGGGGSSSSVNPASNPFEGHWTGTVVENPGGAGGMAEFVVDSAGNMTGSAYFPAGPITTQVVGTISSSGAVSGNLNGVTPFAGQLNLNGNSCTGTIAYSAQGTTYTDQFTLTRT